MRLPFSPTCRTPFPPYVRNQFFLFRLLSFSTRRRLLRILARAVLEHTDDICRISSRDSGKTTVDAAFGEVLPISPICDTLCHALFSPYFRMEFDFGDPYIYIYIYIYRYSSRSRSYTGSFLRVRRRSVPRSAQRAACASTRLRVSSGIRGESSAPSSRGTTPSIISSTPSPQPSSPETPSSSR